MLTLSADDRIIPWQGDDERLWSFWDMLQSYLPIYEIALKLQRIRTRPELLGNLARSTSLSKSDQIELQALLQVIEKTCTEMLLPYTANMAKRVLSRPLPTDNGELVSIVNHLNDSLSEELERDSIFRIPQERKGYFEQDDLFGPEIATAFPSCKEDVQRAGSCYALGQGDASVYHLMLVLEHGLRSLAARLNVPFDRANWQVMIDGIGKAIKALPRSPERDFYQEANSQFFHLKNTHRNHSAHVHDFPYDTETALSTLNHVRNFMRALEKGGLTE